MKLCSLPMSLYSDLGTVAATLRGIYRIEIQQDVDLAGLNLMPIYLNLSL